MCISLWWFVNCAVLCHAAGAAQVMSPGTYDVVMFYTSTATATLKLSIGTYASILAGTANSLTTTLPAQVGYIYFI